MVFEGGSGRGQNVKYMREADSSDGDHSEICCFMRTDGHCSIDSAADQDDMGIKIG